MQRFFLLLLMALTVTLLACSAVQPSIAVEPKSLELGNVINGEIVQRDVTVRNNGEADLIIDSILTSCACTTAEVTPTTIAAGQSGVLKVAFDSGYHGPDLTGPLIRQVFIKSNDPQQPEIEIELSVVVEAGSS